MINYKIVVHVITNRLLPQPYHFYHLDLEIYQFKVSVPSESVKFLLLEIVQTAGAPFFQQCVRQSLCKQDWPLLGSPRDSCLLNPSEDSAAAVVTTAVRQIHTFLRQTQKYKCFMRWKLNGGKWLGGRVMRKSSQRNFFKNRFQNFFENLKNLNFSFNTRNFILNLRSLEIFISWLNWSMRYSGVS